DWGSAHRQARALLARLGVDTDVRQPLMNLNVAMQQMVAIARALSHDVSLVVMDEPTSSLDDREVETLFETIRGLRASGVGVIFISHRLDELYALCEHVTIMRDGATVASRSLASMPKLELVATMLGKGAGEVQREGQTGFHERGVVERLPLLEVSGIARGRALRGVTVSVGRGEIVGLAGLLGSGRTEVARAIFGADTIEAGTITLDGRTADLSTPAAAIRAGIGFCSEDRKAEGIVPALSVRENLTLAALPLLSRNGIVDRARQQAIVDRFIARLGIKLADADQPIRELSGGNQQKVLLARWLCLDPRLLLLDEPTRGIDVGAKAEIQSLIDELAGEGLGVLMISSEMEELLEGGDRVVVLRDGTNVAAFSHDEVSQGAVLEAMAMGSGATDPDSGAVTSAGAV
ncbi:MAG: sugar ABC transporter ATP-binding protein, partial [Chloroflexota bacterium]|nr:sugar ABC transporter ATP-binding protein [Chloroflexota bacterium]